MEIYKKYINESMMLSGKRHVGFAGIDEIGKFYLVTPPGWGGPAGPKYTT